MAGIEDIVGKTGNYHVRDRFKRFDNKFIRPLILKHVQVWNILAWTINSNNINIIMGFSLIDLCICACNFYCFFSPLCLIISTPSMLLPKLKQSAEPKILETYSKLAMKDAMDFMQRNPSTIGGQMTGTESMSALFRSYQTGAGRLAPPFLMNPW